MPRTRAEIEALLDSLEERCAEELEDQDLDFKEWDGSSMAGSVRTVIDMAVCMANGGGGTVVFGVADKPIGRDQTVLGVPAEVQINKLKLAVYDSTDPKLTPVFEELRVPEGTGRLVLMHVHPGIPPYTDTRGRGTTRVGRDCKPLTGTLRARLLEHAGENDFTAGRVDTPVARLLSPSAMESLRQAAAEELAPAELLRLGDQDLLEATGVVREGAATRALVLLAGSPSAIREHVPNYTWTHLRMSTNTDYSSRADGNEAIPLALSRILDRVLASEPIETVRKGLFHFEYRTYPEIALREALLNAFCHSSFRIAGPRIVKQFSDRIEITNPGGLVGGLTPENILHQAPVTRNPCLVDALTRLRLINRANLGIERMYTAFLVEGKPPPQIQDKGDSVTVTFHAAKISPAFRTFVANEASNGIDLAVDHMLILRHVLHNVDIDASDAARLCQRSPRDARDVLLQMEEFGHLGRSGNGRETYWTLTEQVRSQLIEARDPSRMGRGDWEAAKVNVLRALRRRTEQGDPGLTNREIRLLTALDRNRAWRLMGELRREFPEIGLLGRGRAARYVWSDGK